LPADVEGRVVRGINEGGQQQNCRNDAQKSHQLVEPLVFRWGQKAHESLLSVWGRLSVAAGAGAFAIPLGGTLNANDDTKQKLGYTK
jgi:hypothetical protein